MNLTTLKTAIAVLLLLIGCLATDPAVVFAQSEPQTNSATSGDNLADRANWNGFLTSSEQAITREGLTDRELGNIASDANSIETNSRLLIDEQAPQLEKLKQQLDELGPAPKEGEPAEAEEIATQRKKLDEAFADLDGQIKDARLALVRSRQLKSDISQKRRDRFVRSISNRSDNILNYDFWSKFVTGFNGYGKSFILMVKDSFQILRLRLGTNPMSGILVLLGCVVGFFIYRFAQSKMGLLQSLLGDSQLDEDSKKAVHAAIKFVKSGVIPVLSIFYLLELFSQMDLLTNKLERFVWTATNSVAFVILANTLGRVFLAPKHPELRIADVSDEAAKYVFQYGLSAVVVVAVLYILNDTAVMLVSPFEVSVGLSFLHTLVTNVTLIRILFLISKDRVDNPQPAFYKFRFLNWVYIRPLLWLSIIFGFLALLFSYVALSEFIALQLLAGSMLIAVLWLVLELIDSMKRVFLSSDQNSHAVSKRIGIQPGRVKQAFVLGFGVLKTTILLLGAMAMLLPWGFRTAEWVDWVRQAFFGFQIGGLTISISTIVTVVILFLIGYAVTKAIQNWLTNQFLPTTGIDIGLRNSISTILGYIGVIVAAMMAISAAGLDLSNLAIVAGALSVGVGFGLQSIVNNFVSGLILLAERPIKSGDWIITSGGEGTVRKISVRSTEIETFERATIIVPNSTLITDSVTNWTHTSKFGRISIIIGVGYDSDPDQVRQILLDCIVAHEGILKRPAPEAFFTDFGADALMFDVRGFLSNIEDGFKVKSDLRFAILRSLREANIEIPFPQRDIHIKSDATLMPAPTPKRRSAAKMKATKA